MFKPSVTIHKSITGEITVIECSESSSLCLESYKACKIPGQLAYFRMGHLDRFKKIPVDTMVAKPKAAKKTAKSKKTILQ